MISKQSIVRQSRQRNRILDLLRSTETHPTADWLYERLKPEFPKLSLGTVYRNLGRLVENEVLKSIDINGAVHYDSILANHQHFLCKFCDKVYDINIDTEEFVSEIGTKTTHEIDNCQIRLTGTCEECKNN